MVNIFSQDLKCVLIDWDGTLVTAEPLVHEAYVATFKSLGDDRTWTMADTHARNGEDTKKIFVDKTLWGENGEKARKLFYGHYTRLKMEQPELLTVKENAAELLDFIGKVRPDIKIIILAAKTQTILAEEVLKKGFSSRVHAIVGHTENGPNKPDKRVVERALSAVGLVVTDKAKQVMHIGDNLDKDEVFAREAGVISFVVNENGDIKDLKQLQTKLATVKSAKTLGQKQVDQHQYE